MFENDFTSYIVKIDGGPLLECTFCHSVDIDEDKIRHYPGCPELERRFQEKRAQLQREINANEIQV